MIDKFWQAYPDRDPPVMLATGRSPETRVPPRARAQARLLLSTDVS
jgi:hypothetical protein